MAQKREQTRWEQLRDAEMRVQAERNSLALARAAAAWDEIVRQHFLALDEKGITLVQEALTAYYERLVKEGRTSSLAGLSLPGGQCLTLCQAMEKYRQRLELEKAAGQGPEGGASVTQGLHWKI